MAEILTVRVGEGSESTWVVDASDRTRQPQRGIVPRDRVLEIQAANTRLRGATPLVLRVGQDGGVVQAELELGRALGVVLNASIDVRDVVVAARQRSSQRGEELVVLLDLETPAIQRFPWELLAWSVQGSQIEATPRTTIVRRLPGPSARPTAPETNLRVLCWTPASSDAVVQQVVDQHRETWQAAGLDVVMLDADLDALPVQQAGVGDILHLICHGVVADGRVEVSVGDGMLSATAVSHLLSTLGDRTRLVVLDICRGGASTGDLLHNPAAALLAAGVPAVIAPRTSCDRRAAIVFGRGLYQALAESASLGGAIAAGRRSVIKLADPHPDARWSNHRLLIADLSVLEGGPLRSDCWRPTTWPVPNPAAVEVLNQARALARAWDEGFVGFEHIVRALHKLRPTGRGVQAMLDALAPVLESGHEILRPLPRTAQEPGPLVATARLVACGPRLRTGFSPDDMVAVMLEDPRSTLYLRMGLGTEAIRLTAVPTVSTVYSQAGDLSQPEPQGVGEAAQAVEVVGGPDDGRCFTPKVGDIIGRYDPTGAMRPDVKLYEGCPRADLRVSRLHVEWEGAGALHLLHEGLVLRAGAREVVPPDGRARLCVGDILVLGRETWLMGVHAPAPTHL